MRTFEIQFTVDEHDDRETRNINDELTEKFEKLITLSRDMRGVKEVSIDITDYEGMGVGKITMK